VRPRGLPEVENEVLKTTSLSLLDPATATLISTVMRHQADTDVLDFGGHFLSFRRDRFFKRGGCLGIRLMPHEMSE
jgi:hypothetical protein